jgi:hypothetical protein
MTPTQAKAAVEELARAYPLRSAPQQVVELDATAGYLPDESVYGVVFGLGAFRVHVETAAAQVPMPAAQRAELEEFTLHLADHMARRVQEQGSGGRRTGPEGMAVHWRDHISRALKPLR